MFKLSQAAAAAGIPAPTLSSWIDRGFIPMPKNGTGNHHEFSLRDVDRIGIVAELARLGLPISEAAKAASAFSDERSAKRPKGQLHRDGKTLLIIDADGTSVVRAFDRGGFEDAMSKLYADTRSVIVLNATEALRRVDAALAGSHKPLPPAGAIFRHGKQLMI